MYKLRVSSKMLLKKKLSCMLMMQAFVVFCPSMNGEYKVCLLRCLLNHFMKLLTMTRRSSPLVYMQQEKNLSLIYESFFFNHTTPFNHSPIFRHNIHS